MAATSSSWWHWTKQTGRNAWQVNRSIDYKDLDGNGKPQVDGDYRKAFATCQVIEAGEHPCPAEPGIQSAICL